MVNNSLLSWIVMLIHFIHNIHSQQQQIDKVHMVFSNHFDCGFANTATNIVNEYFTSYFPNAVKYGDNFTSLNVNKTYAWMTQSWLISMYFDCPSGMGLKCPSEEEKKVIQGGIDKGYIFWHGFPFNSQQEVYDIDMLEFGLRLSRDMSNQRNTRISKILSQRDVPGLTRSMIPILLKNNITAISVGVNDGSAPPNVPKIFRWKDNISNKIIIGMWNPKGYGTPSTYPVIINNYNEALVFAWKGDNDGPPDVNSADSFYSQTQKMFPNAQIISSSITNFVDALILNQSIYNNLPLIDIEIGDSWIHGIQSDPWKTAINRAAQRERSKCLKNGNCSYESIGFYNFSRLLLKNGEHTWGGDIKHYLGYGKNGSDYYAWSNQQLQSALSANNGSNPMTTFRNTWYEQREWGCFNAMEALSISTNQADKQLYNSIMKEWNFISNVQSPLEMDKNWIMIKDPTQKFQVKSSFNGKNYEIQFDSNSSGALNTLIDKTTNINYADNNNLLGELIYATYTEQDFDYYLATYTYNPSASYMPGDFGKSGLDSNANPQNYYLSAKFIALYQNSHDPNQFLVEMNFGDLQQILHTKYGAPNNIFQSFNFSSIDATFSTYLTWINKNPTRIPEDYFLRFNPINCSDWKVEKFDQMVSMNDIILNGSMHMAATTGNVSCHNIIDTFNIEPIDVALTTFKPIDNWRNHTNQYSPFPVPFVNSSNIEGTAFVLYDNTWGTNYPVWWPFDSNQANSSFRFNVFV